MTADQPRGFPKAAKEENALEALRIHLERERGTSFRYLGAIKPPDLALEEAGTNRRLAVAHTRVIQEDLSYVKAWDEIFQAVKRQRMPGQYFIGTDIDYPLPQREDEVNKLLGEIRNRVQSTDWSKTNSIVVPGPNQGVRIIQIDPTGSDVFPIRARGGIRRGERARRTGNLVQEELERLNSLAGYSERILAVDVSHVHRVEVGICAAHVVDAIEWAGSSAGSTPVDSVYFVRNAEAGFDIRRVWP